MSAVAKIGSGRRTAPKTAAPSEGVLDCLSVIDRMALDPNIPTERLEMMVRREVEARSDAARRAYDQAMTRMQPDLPAIAENGKVLAPDGSVKHTYAEWEDIVDDIRPVLTVHGFNLTFRSQPGKGQVEITAICAHNEGHREEATVPMVVDLSDGKNDNQGMRSATSYGKRAAATLLLNIITRGEDDDGARSMGAAGEPCLTADQIEKIRAALTTYGRTDERLLKVLKIDSLEKLPVSRHDEALGLVHALGRQPILRAKGDK